MAPINSSSTDAAHREVYESVKSNEVIKAVVTIKTAKKVEKYRRTVELNTDYNKFPIRIIITLSRS